MKNLKSRIEKLEYGKDAGELPNGGMLLVIAKDSEGPEAALAAALNGPNIAGLSESQKRRLVPVFVSSIDASL